MDRQDGQDKKKAYCERGLLQELMQAEAGGIGHAEEVLHLAKLLEPWCAGGSYGALFDGVSNVSLTGRVAHFELGAIPKSATELKEAAGFLIVNQTRNHMMGMSRVKRKRNVWRGQRWRFQRKAMAARMRKDAPGSRKG